MSDERAVLRLETKLDSLITQQHVMAESISQQTAAMRVRLEEYEKRLDRNQREIIQPLERKVDLLQSKHNEIISDLREISKSLSEVSKIVDHNRSAVSDMQMSRAKAAGIIAGITAFITVVSAFVGGALKVFFGG